MKDEDDVNVKEDVEDDSDNTSSEAAVLSDNLFDYQVSIDGVVYHNFNHYNYYISSYTPGSNKITLIKHQFSIYKISEIVKMLFLKPFAISITPLTIHIDKHC